MILRRFIAAFALLCALAAPACAQPFTKAQLNAQVGVSFPDNVVGAITPAVTRTQIDAIINSILPTAPVVSGNLACWDGTTGLLKDCTSTLPGGLSVPNLTITQSNSALFLTGVTPGIELGSTGTTNLPFVDFHSSGNNIDYDVRIIASGGTSTVGQGGLSIVASLINLGNSTNPSLLVDSSTVSQICGLRVKGDVTGGTVALIAIDSGAACNVSANAKGIGTFAIGNVSIGQVQLGAGGGGVSIGSALTYGGITFANSATGSASSLLVGSLSPTITTPSFVFGTSGLSIIAAASANTGNQNSFQAQNSGTLSNSGTIATVVANLTAGVNAFVGFSAIGGASPSGSLSTGAGLTGGFSISAAAGTLTIAAPTITTSFTATGLVTLADLATQATNTVLVNATSGPASPTAQSVSSCSSASSALIWTTNTGFGCNTSITANAVPAANLTGTTLAAGVTGSSLTSVGTLTALTMGGNLAMGTHNITGGGTATFTSYVAGANTGVASKSCAITTANVSTGITLTITGGLITGTTTC